MMHCCRVVEESQDFGIGAGLGGEGAKCVKQSGKMGSEIGLDRREEKEWFSAVKQGIAGKEVGVDEWRGGRRCSAGVKEAKTEPGAPPMPGKMGLRKRGARAKGARCDATQNEEEEEQDSADQ